MSLRIVSPTAPTEARAFAEEAGSSVDQYMGRLVKLVPVEAISAYPLLRSLAVEQGLWAEILISWLLLGVSIFLRWNATSIKGQGPQKMAVAIAGISFVIWVNVIGGHFGVRNIIAAAGFQELASVLGSAKEFLATVALVIWTILVPVVYTGDNG